MDRSLGRLFVLASCIVLFGVGCEKLVPVTLPVVLQRSATTTATGAPPSAVIGWSARGPGVDRTAFRFSTSTASEVVIYRFSRTKHTFGFRHSTSSAAVSEWMGRESEALFAANGVYFHEDELPSGWFRTEGKVIGTRSFDADKSALLVLGPNPTILVNASEQKAAKQKARDAAQSFPLLISGGVAVVKEDSGKVARRTFVGTDKTQEYLYVGIVPYTGISLYELSQALTRLPVRWEAVLNLDGGPSSGIVFRSPDQSETIDSYVTVPNVLVIHPKN